MKRVLFLTSESFPYGKAYASRARAIIKTLKNDDFHITVLCDQKSCGDEFDECTIVEALGKQNNYLKKVLLVPRIYSKVLDDLLSREQFDYIISRSMSDRYNSILPVIKKHSVPFIIDSVERYDVKSFKRGRFDFRYYQFLSFWKRSGKDADGIIAISRYLKKYFEKFCPVIRIPGILDTDYITKRDHTWKKPYKLIYSGDISGGKEILESIMLAVNKFPNDYVLDIYGPTEKEVYSSFKNNKSTKTSFRNTYIHGRIPQEELYKVINKSDFGIFIRPKRDSSEAGFPTKLGEYLSAGLPVIVNNTGDIPLILKDGHNGFLLDEGTEDEIVFVLKDILRMSEIKLKEMSNQAVKTANAKLLPSVYSDEFRHFLENISKKES